MKNIVFGFNLILVIVGFVTTILANTLMKHDDNHVGFLMVLGFFQIIISLFYTIYYATKVNDNIIIGYVFYWMMVIAFFNGLFWFHTCLFIAAYQCYLTYCQAENLKYNLFK